MTVTATERCDAFECVAALVRIGMDSSCDRIYTANSTCSVNDTDMHVMWNEQVPEWLRQFSEMKHDRKSM